MAVRVESRKATKSKGLNSPKLKASKNLAGKVKKLAAVKAPEKKVSLTKKLYLPKALLVQMYDHMVKSRVLEERLIKVYKLGEAYFWIGGPGEEAFGVPLGLLADKGQGVNHDWLHMHYRCTPTLVAMGMPVIDGLRLIMNKATDVSSGGRNFAGHYCYPQWNVAPVSSPIEVQYIMAIGTAHAQKRHKAKGITIVTGGDAGTAEGDFASCLVWASRKGNELPMLITVQNNKWGISTSFHGQHGEAYIADRGKAFGIRTSVINGNDPQESYLKLQEEIAYIRKTGKPCLMEAMVSRLYGHSSASGANRIDNEVDPVMEFQQLLLETSTIDQKLVDETWQKYDDEAKAAFEIVKTEPVPQSDTIWDHVFVDNENADWRKF
jgi:2-oxoisovalerate dehydrogenase E1 component alpha subunit